MKLFGISVVTSFLLFTASFAQASDKMLTCALQRLAIPFEKMGAEQKQSAFFNAEKAAVLNYGSEIGISLFAQVSDVESTDHTSLLKSKSSALQIMIVKTDKDRSFNQILNLLSVDDSSKFFSVQAILDGKNSVLIECEISNSK